MRNRPGRDNLMQMNILPGRYFLHTFIEFISIGGGSLGTVDCSLLETIAFSLWSHGQIRFAGSDVIMYLIGPCDLAS